ncbi:MAG: uroporphyrinogen-III C-methyltransferase [Rhizobacter sp.]|nr:uroporphyrinogen-III C-methyltransferase [Rhizobacter sp.]
MSNLDETRWLSPQPGVMPRPARVLLVGAGPGDPDLLTVKAARALASASIVLYDHLVSREVLALVPPEADLVYVGKESAMHTLPQEAIIELMLRIARSGRPVLRLKGGDPYIFGRGGEEAQALAAAGVPFEVVPGISAAQGASASAGIPLTHRDHAAGVLCVTGHLRVGARDELDLDWPALARPRQTLVVYMGVAALPVISAQLIRHGLDAQTPAAVIERATLPGQRTLVGNLQNLPDLARQQGVRAPALIVIGSVVSLHHELAAAMCLPECDSLDDPQGMPGTRREDLPILAAQAQ